MSVALKINPKYRVLFTTVVDGNAVPIARNCVSYVKARAVPSSLIRTISFCPPTAVPPGLFSFNAPACAVTSNWSVVDTSKDVPVSVVYDAAVVRRGFVLLFVSVEVDDIVGTVTPSTAITPADTRVTEVSEAWPSSMEPTPRAVDVDAVMPETRSQEQPDSVPEAGVPSAPPLTRMLLPSMAATPAETRESVVSVAWPSSIFPRVVIVPPVLIDTFSTPAFDTESSFAPALERLVVVSSRYAMAEAPSATAGNIPVRSVEL